MSTLISLFIGLIWPPAGIAIALIAAAAWISLLGYGLFELVKSRFYS
jgi:hypothetical protein